jgi:hypothetical protein
MEDEEDQELEQYVSQHKDEPLRQIQEGMEKEFGRTKSTKWITPRRDAALLAESIIDEEAEIPPTEETKEEPEIEEDPEIIEAKKQIRNTNVQIMRVKTKTELKKAQSKLVLAMTNHKTIEELQTYVNFLKKLRKEDKKIISLLKERLEAALEKAIPTYVNNAKCDKCDGRFLWEYTGDVGGNNVICYVCQTKYKLVD